MKIRIVKKEFSTWEDHKNECLNHTQYKLQYQKSFLGIKYWKNFKEVFCGMEDCFTSTIWMNSKEDLIKRFNCEISKIKISYEQEQVIKNIYG